MHTFLMTDIEGSTRLWETKPKEMRIGLEKHDRILSEVIASHNGEVFKTAGDAFYAVFDSSLNALLASCDIHLTLKKEDWGDVGEIKVRVGIHSGEINQSKEDYSGQAMNRALGVQSTAHGRQTILTHLVQSQVSTLLPEGIELLDLGIHQLKDLQAPERIWQVSHPELPNSFPPLKSLSSFANNLPLQTSSFVGRESEIEDIKDTLKESPLLTLTGMGGTGKTRISLQVGAEMMEFYKDGVWFIEFASLTDPDLVIQAFAKALNIPESGDVPLAQAMIDRLKKKKSLLIFDNCEHLLANIARLATVILRNCPEIHILASSREALGISGERVYRLPSLELPEPLRGGYTETNCPSLQTLASYPGIQLFVERASQVNQDFALTSENRLPTLQLCLRLDGIPLALELAAARVRAMPVEEITRRLDQRFRILTGGSRTSLPRQQTLRALIDWSYDLLEDNQKLLFERLTVFSNGWTLEASEAICADEENLNSWEILDLLIALVDKSLVLYHEKAGAGRYRMTESLREYAQEKFAQAGGDIPLQRRHRDYYYALLHELKERFYGPDESKSLSVLDLEHDNLARVMDLGLFDEESLEKAQSISAELLLYWRVRGYYTEGRIRLKGLLELKSERTIARAAALNTACALAYLQGDYEEALLFGEEGLSIQRELKDKNGIGVALGNLANLLNYMGRYETAKVMNEEALVLFRELNAVRSIARTLNGLGNVMVMLGEAKQAEEKYSESLALRREMQDSLGVGVSLSNLCDIAYHVNDLEKVEALNEESERIYSELADKRGLAIVNEWKGILAESRGDFEHAQHRYSEALDLYRAIGDKRGYLHFMDLSMKLAIKQGFHERGAKLYGSLEALRQAIKYPTPPHAQLKIVELRHTLQSELSPETYSSLYSEGMSLALESALEYANAKNDPYEISVSSRAEGGG